MCDHLDIVVGTIRGGDIRVFYDRGKSTLLIGGQFIIGIRGNVGEYIDSIIDHEIRVVSHTVRGVIATLQVVGLVVH
jgi:hypothetical protein